MNKKAQIHIDAAEQLLKKAKDPSVQQLAKASLIAQAQVHATLALTHSNFMD